MAKIVDERARVSGIVAGVDYADQSAAFDRDAPAAIIWEQVRTGQASPSLGLAALREVDKLADRFYEDRIPDVTDGFLTVGVDADAKVVRRSPMRVSRSPSALTTCESIRMPARSCTPGLTARWSGSRRCAGCAAMPT